jgi:hypothetical protein
LQSEKNGLLTKNSEKMNTRTDIISFKKALLEVEYYYQPGDPGVHTYANGDPGHPPTPPEVDITSVQWIKEIEGKKREYVNIDDLLDERDWDEIYDAVYEGDFWKL